jgi:hypothetical protein
MKRKSLGRCFGKGCYGRNGEDESGDSDHSVFVEYGS